MLEHRGNLDGIRAIAVILVMLYHCGVPGFMNGYNGVDVFFVLSGFLITSLLLRELKSTQNIDLIFFYVRRARRLLPASAFVLLCTGLAYNFAATPFTVTNNAAGFYASALYVANWQFIRRSTDYWSSDIAISPVLHYWSLSAEEQFYACYPLLLWFFFRIILPGFVVEKLRIVQLIFCSMAMVSFMYPFSQTNETIAHMSTISRVYQLICGGILSLQSVLWDHLNETAVFAQTVVLPEETPAETIATRFPVQVEAQVSVARQSEVYLYCGKYFISGICSFMGLIIIFLAATSWMSVILSRTLIGALTTLGTISLLVGLEFYQKCAPNDSFASAIDRCLSFFPVRELGTLSYSLYLWHWPLIVIGDLLNVLPGVTQPRSYMNGWIRFGIVFAVALFLSAASRYLLEKPFLKLDVKNGWRKIVGIACIIFTPIVLCTIFYYIMSGSTVGMTNDSISNNSSAPLFYPIVEPSETTFFYPANDTDRPTILIAGDSHSMQFLLAASQLSADLNINIAHEFRGGCFNLDVAATRKVNSDGQIFHVSDKCPKVHVSKTVSLVRQHGGADIAILFSAYSAPEVDFDGNGVFLKPTDSEYLIRYKQAIAKFLDLLQPYVKFFVLVAPEPEYKTANGLSIPECVSTEATLKNPHACDSSIHHSPFYAEVVKMLEFAVSGRGVVVTMDPVLCPHNACPAVFNGYVTSPDGSHVEPHYWLDKRSDFYQRIQEFGVDLATGTFPA